MDPEKPPAETPTGSGDTSDAPQDNAPEPATTADPRIQFAPAIRPSGLKKPNRGDDDPITAARRQSINSIPQVISEKEKSRRRREKEEEKNVDITEHLLSHEQVAGKLSTQINLWKPAESFGLATQQIEGLHALHGLNVLTPPPKRHPFLRYLDYLTSLFNLLLILAGVLEYILLGIDFKNNFQNVSPDPVAPQ
jgi:sodium/potassium-transporting ATPase subunit alpha